MLLMYVNTYVQTNIHLFVISYTYTFSYGDYTCIGQV